MRKYLKYILFVMIACVAVYVSVFYHAGDEAQAILDGGAVVDEGNWLALSADESEVGVIFYPGAKVAHTAYLPLAQQLANQGVNCYVVEMPLKLAILGTNRADAVQAAHPEIKRWYMAGHSMGGAFASSYAASHREAVEGLMLLGAYRYGNYPADQSVVIYGSEDGVLNRERLTKDDHLIVLEGGNHAQFGDYGVQKGDGTATISADEQRQQTVEAMVAFINE